MHQIKPYFHYKTCFELMGGLKKNLGKIKTLAESALPPPPPHRTLRHSLYDFHILHRPPPQFRLRHFLYDFWILDLPPLQTRLSHSLYDFFFFFFFHIPPYAPYPLPALFVHTIFPCMDIMTCCCSYKNKNILPGPPPPPNRKVT